MDIKSELIKRLDDHGYKLNDEGNIVIKFSELDNGVTMTTEKLTLEIGDGGYIRMIHKNKYGDSSTLVFENWKRDPKYTLKKYTEMTQKFVSEFFLENRVKVVELLQLIHDILDEIISNNNTPERYPTQSKKDVIEKELKDCGWSESEGVFGIKDLTFGIYDDNLEITDDCKLMVIYYEDLIKNTRQHIDDIRSFFGKPQLFFDPFIEDLVSIIKGMSIKTQVQNEIPKRYQTQSGKNFIDVLRNEMMSHERFLGFLEGNVYKYVFRYRNKGGKKDLRKAKHYLDLLEAEIDE